MREKIYTGQYGRLKRHIFAHGPFAVPERLKIYRETARLAKPHGETKFKDASGDLKLWVFGKGFYEWRHLEGAKDSFSRLMDGADVELLGYDWALGPLLYVGGVLHMLKLATPLPLIGADGETSWMDSLTLDDTAIFTRSLAAAESCFFGRWCETPIALTYSWETYQAKQMEAAIKASSSTAEKQALEKRFSEIQTIESGNLRNEAGLYAVSWYDCNRAGVIASIDEAVDDRQVCTPAAGGLWIENGRLYACGLKSAGQAYVVPTMFDADGACLGLSVVNAGSFRREADGYIVPVQDGVVHAVKVDGAAVGELHPVQGAFTLHLWDGTEAVQAVDDGYISGDWGFAAMPHVLTFGSGQLLSKTFESGLPKTYGGQGATIREWCLPGNQKPADMAGPLLLAHDSTNTFITDMRSLRGHIDPGAVVDIVEDGAGSSWLRSAGTDGDDAVAREAPVKSIGAGSRFSEDIQAQHVIVPWRGECGKPLEFGWWNFPDLNVKGNPPVPSKLGNGHGDDDFEDGTFLDVRKGLSVTSDGYIYATGDSGKAEVLAWHYGSDGWKSNRAAFSVADTRVAPYGQGNYRVYHYPGTDWSIFHAPCGSVTYQRLVEDNSDLWAGLMPYAGLAGGFAIYDAISGLNAMQDYLKESMGNAMIVYTWPKQKIVVGDALFRNFVDKKIETGYFWTFSGWTIFKNSPVAVFSRVACASGNNPTPEIWGVSPQFCRRLSLKEAGEAGINALTLVPSTYYARWGEMPDGTDQAGLLTTISNIIGDSPCLYDLPEPDGTESKTGIAGAALVKRMNAWRTKATDVNAESITTGQSWDDNIMQTAVIDASVPLLDARIDTDASGVTWIRLRHATGVWLAVRCDVELNKALLETTTPWQLVSLGVMADGTICALFGNGRCSFDIGDRDATLASFGMGNYWERFALRKWYSRYVPVLIRQDSRGFKKLIALWNK